MTYQTEHLFAIWQKRTWLVPSLYRLLTYVIAVVWLFAIPLPQHQTLTVVLLAVGAGVYSLFKIIHPLRWNRAGVAGYSLLTIDVLVCAFLLLVTGNLCSPFMLYILTPVLTSALLLDSRVTLCVATVSGVIVIASHVASPFFPAVLSVAYLSHFAICAIAVIMIAALPYLTNVNLRQHLQYEDTLHERQRLSREIHDGAAQSVAALRWQAQLTLRRLADMGVNLPEARELLRLADRAWQDTRESLEILRAYNGEGNFLPHFKEYVQYLGQTSNINFQVDLQANNLHLDPLVELQLLRIAQEALINVSKHSGARTAQVKLSPVKDGLRLTIADDGRGFETVAHHRYEIAIDGHGLDVMQERAESVGGHLEVRSMLGKGTEVEVEVPVNNHRGRLSWLDR